MADLKTTKEERARLRLYIDDEPCKILELSKAQTEGLLDDLDTLEAENAALRSLLESFRDGWDCDEDAHRYKTQCRCCAAAAALSKVKP